MLAKILARPYIDLLDSGPNFDSMSNDDLITCFIHSNSDLTTNLYQLSTKDRNDMIKFSFHPTTRQEVIEILQASYEDEDYDHWTKRAYGNMPHVLSQGKQYLKTKKENMEDLVARTVCMGYNTNGLGVVVGPEHIITCAHLVSPSRRIHEIVGRYKVCYLWQGEKIVRALSRCIAADLNCDLALVHLIEAQNFPRPILPLPPRMALSIPSPPVLCMLIGNPAKDSKYSKHKPWRVLIDVVTESTPVSMRRQKRILGDMQHEFPTYWGDSGGSIYDADGVLIGIHNAYSKQFQILTGVSAVQIRKFVDTHINLKTTNQTKPNPLTPHWNTIREECQKSQQSSKKKENEKQSNTMVLCLSWEKMVDCFEKPEADDGTATGQHKQTTTV